MHRIKQSKEQRDAIINGKLREIKDELGLIVSMIEHLIDYLPILLDEGEG